MKGVLHELGNAVGAVDRGHPLGHLPEHAPVIDLLEGFALDEIGPDLSDEQDHRRGILIGGVQADRGVGGTRPAGRKADARLAGQFAPGLGHIGRAAFLTADHQWQGLAHVMQRIEHREETLARHAKRPSRAVNNQLVDKDLTAAARRQGCGDRSVCHGAAVVWASELGE